MKWRLDGIIVWAGLALLLGLLVLIPDWSEMLQSALRAQLYQMGYRS